MGEIILNSIDNDGVMGGYDIDVLHDVSKTTRVPIVALGGAGKLSDMTNIVNTVGITAAAAGSLFIYHGKLKGILINYPGFDEVQLMIEGKK